MTPTPPFKGGQGRTPEDIVAGGNALANKLVLLGVLLLVATVVEALR